MLSKIRFHAKTAWISNLESFGTAPLPWGIEGVWKQGKVSTSLRLELPRMASGGIGIGEVRCADQVEFHFAANRERWWFFLNKPGGRFWSDESRMLELFLCFHGIGG